MGRRRFSPPCHRVGVGWLSACVHWSCSGSEPSRPWGNERVINTRVVTVAVSFPFPVIYAGTPVALCVPRDCASRERPSLVSASFPFHKAGRSRMSSAARGNQVALCWRLQTDFVTISELMGLIDNAWEAAWFIVSTECSLLASMNDVALMVRWSAIGTCLFLTIC